MLHRQSYIHSWKNIISSDKKIILFATSGGSGFGNTMRELQPSVPNSVIEEGRIFNNTTRQQIMKWVETL